MANFKEKLMAVKDVLLGSGAEPAQESMITATGAIDTLQDFAYLIGNVKGQYNFNAEQIARCDAETQDLLHEIELTSFSAAKGYMLVKELKKVREDRRYYKDQNEILEYLVAFLEKYPFLSNTTDGLIQSMTGRIKALAEREYKPRVRIPVAEPGETAQ